MQRKQCEITDPKKIQRILDTTNIGRLATNGADGYPYITPVNFVYHQGNIYFHCAPRGEKLQNLERDARVCFTVDIPLAYLDSTFDAERRIKGLGQLYHCVIIRGEARVVPDGPLKVAVLNALVAKHEKSSGHELVNEDMPNCYGACKVVGIKPASVSAKSQLCQTRSPEEQSAIARYLTSRDRPGDLETVRAMGFGKAQESQARQISLEVDFARLEPTAGTPMLVVGGLGGIND